MSSTNSSDSADTNDSASSSDGLAPPSSSSSSTDSPVIAAKTPTTKIASSEVQESRVKAKARLSDSALTLISGIFILLMLAWTIPGHWSFAASVAALLLFLLTMSFSITGQFFGFLVNELNLVSLPRFQTAMWTVILLSAYLALALAKIKAGAKNPLDIAIDENLWVLLGISVTSLVGSPLLSNTKRDKKPDSKEVTKTADAMVATGNVPASVNSNSSEMTDAMNDHMQGILYANPNFSDASFTDMFEGDEVGNTAHIDLAKVQMFFFTVILGFAYCSTLWTMFGQLAGAQLNTVAPTLDALPSPSQGMIALLGISHAGFLGSTGVPRTKQQS